MRISALRSQWNIIILAAYATIRLRPHPGPGSRVIAGRRLISFNHDVHADVHAGGHGHRHRVTVQTKVIKYLAQVDAFAREGDPWGYAMTATATTVPANAAPARRTAESVSIGTVAPLDAVESTSFDGANVHASMPA